MDNIRWHHSQPQITLRFKVSLEQYLENCLLFGGLAECAMTVVLPQGFCLSITRLLLPLSDPTGTTAFGIAAKSNSIDVTPQVAELCLKQSQPTCSQNATSVSTFRDVKTAHLVEVHQGGRVMHLSKSINGQDLLDGGIIYADEILSPWYRTFEIVLTFERNSLLVSSDTLDLKKVHPQKQPFGKVLLAKFLHDVARSADIEYVIIIGTEVILHGLQSKDPTMTSVAIQGRSSPISAPEHSSIFAHYAVVSQWNGFAAILENHTRKGGSPDVQELNDIDPNTMQLLINFIYLGQIEGPAYSGTVNWHHLFQAAHRFQVYRLADLASGEMCKEIAHKRKK
ncbi:hypothetical protein BGX27_011611 [Mortierella sp. AM989]|nr:hypothetical protein BGX27_011611 [Mortierella sp. AM989]